MKRSAFTLIELLVVVTIIIALLAMLLPSMNKAMLRSQEAVCASDTRQIGAAFLTHASDNFGALPDLATNEVYWIRKTLRDQLMADYGLTRDLWYPTTAEAWNQDFLYEENYGNSSVVGRMFFGTTTGNSDRYFNGLLDPVPADRRPLFAQWVSDSPYFDLFITDINRQWPPDPKTIDWSTSSGDTYRVGAAHLYGGIHDLPEGSHAARVDLSVRWTPGNEMAHRITAGANRTEIWW